MFFNVKEMFFGKEVSGTAYRVVSIKIVANVHLLLALISYFKR